MYEIKHFNINISEIFRIFDIEVFGNEIFILLSNMIQRHNFFESFASIGRVDLVRCEASQ